MSSSQRNPKQISAEEESAMQVEAPKLKIRLKQPEQAELSESEVKKMFVAIEENDVKAVRTYLSQKNVHPDTLFKTNVFEENTFTWGALHAAAYYGAKGIINLLMELNANVELQDTWYKGRPLAWAAFGGKFGHLDAAKLLIEKYGADKKAQNEHGQVALELVYEQTPEWEKVFGVTSVAKAAKPSKSKKSTDDIVSPKPVPKDAKPSKDGKEGKNIVTIPANPLVGAFTELYKLVLNHKDKTGRELADIFLALPSKEEYPEYYEIIKSPMSLQLVLSRIKSGHYKNVDDFDREFQLIFENALIFNEDGSRVNKDARVLLKLFNTRKKDVYASYRLVANPKAAALDKGDRQRVATHTSGHITYQKGEFVQLNDPNKTILLIERLETDSKNNKFIAGSKFLRPEQTLQVPGQTFYEQEVLKTSGEWEFDFALVDRKVYVQAHKDYVRGRPINFDPKDVYVCENRYSETGKAAYLIKDWKRVYTTDPLPTPVQPYPSPLKLPKFEVKNISTVYDPSFGPRKGFAMLQSVTIDTEDKSFAMSLGTETFAHSVFVRQQVSTITLVPLLAPQLSPIQQQVGLSVFQNGKKLSPSGLVALPASPTIGHHVYTVALSPGQNTIDIWISAQVGALFQGGGPGGKTETQQFYVFIQRSGV
ncbi:hypothetical protein KVV02_005794 [Mortierella alpina]|uniref:Uncharacterized protein n=1 Tax=Mortierella alpina TaxID=64518 RepID=A0A9P8AAL8_MORAP|nr:hypothetical protein KVV02_005794 [Mortierella alpina]